MSYPVIKASEIAEYVYCGRAWWLRVKMGYAPDTSERLIRGTIHHHQHGVNVARATLARRVALALLFVAVSVFAFWLIRTI